MRFIGHLEFADVLLNEVRLGLAAYARRLVAQRRRRRCDPPSLLLANDYHFVDIWKDLAAGGSFDCFPSE
jgi:hypothetical protein